MNNNRSPAPGAGLLNTIKSNMPNLNLNKRTNSILNNVTNAGNGTTNSNSGFKMPGGIGIITLVFLILILTIIGLFYKQIGTGFLVIWDKFMTLLGLGKQPEATPPVTEPPADSANALPDTGESRDFVNKILPGRAEVFNISTNKYTYADAEPLCKALGAELATYDQVKSAFDQGADWCNYGWTKGQMAVYPTQQSTWEQIQNGPEDQRNACGKPGINGGFFDNPELQFGVNCYGVKPAQKQHDASAIAAGEGQPLTPGALDFEQRVAKYRGEANSIGVLPFSKKAWSA